MLHPFCSARVILARAAALVLVIAGIGSYASAQSVGFVVNSTDGTATVLANATTTLNAQNFSEDVLQTVTFPTQAGQSAVQLVATAVAPAAGTKTPPTRLVYVTDQKNNELWAFDISTISQANAAAKPVAITAGSCSPLFNKPGAIVIATPGSSIFAYVANQGDGTVSIINLSTSACVAKTSALGTITGIAASPDMNEVFVLTSTVGAAAALWEIDTSTQTATKINTSAVGLSNPVSINVQNDASGCYFLAIGDKGNSNVFLAGVGPASDANCPANATTTTAEIVDPQTPTAIQGVNPVSIVSTVVPGQNGGSIYVADAANNEAWEVDCFLDGGYFCNVNQASPIALNDGATPTTMAISVTQSIGETTNQYLYVAGTTSSGPELQNSNVGANGGLFSFSASSVAVGNGPQSLIFTEPDPKDPPVTWFISASGGGGFFQGSTWVMPTTGVLTILGSTIVDLSLPNPTLNLNFGTTAPNGPVGSAIIYCAPFGTQNEAATTCPASDGVAGANAVGGQSSTTSGGGGPGGNETGLDLPASTVFTITLEACAEATCPATPNPATDTVLSQQIAAGGVCTLTVTPSPNTGLNNVAIGQPVNAQIDCVAPATAKPLAGDNLTATITWKTGTTGTVSCTPQTCTVNTPVGGYTYENATLPFASNTYTAAGTYPISITGTDTTESVPILFTGTLPTIKVNGPTISVSPAGTPSNPTPVQLLGTQAFTGTLNFSASTPTVTWTLSVDGVACSPTCGTITNEQATLIAGTLDYNISATYNAPSGVVAGTIILTVASEGASAQAYLATTASSTNPPPSCTLSSPPTSGQTGVAVTVSLSCTAPAGDSLSATVNWSDGQPSTVTGVIADSTGAATLTFTHTFASVGNFAVSVTSIQDTTTGFTGAPPAAFSIAVLQTPTVTPVQTSVSLAAGQSVTFAVNFAGGLSDAGITLTNFACQNQPTGVSCSFSPASITLDANGNSTNTLELTVSLAAPPSLARATPARTSQILLASLWGLPLFGLVILGAVPGDKQRKRRQQAWCALLFILVLIWLPACSSVSQTNVACPTCAPPGTYPITVTGSSVNPELQASTVFQLTVSQ